MAALLAVFVFRRNLSAELTLLSGFGILRNVPTAPPTRTIDWFSLLQENRIIGLTMLDVLDLVEYILVGLIFLALCAALWRTDKSAMVIATTLGIVGITVYLATNQAFSMLALSERYSAAATDVERSMLLAAGEALLAVQYPGSIYQGTGIYLSLLLVLLAGLIYSIVMLRSGVFSRATAVVGILANGIGLCYFLTLIFAPAIYWIPHPISAPFRVIWYFLIALKLFSLARNDG